MIFDWLSGLAFIVSLLLAVAALTSYLLDVARRRRALYLAEPEDLYGARSSELSKILREVRSTGEPGGPLPQGLSVLAMIRLSDYTREAQISKIVDDALQSE